MNANSIDPPDLAAAGRFRLASSSIALLLGALLVALLVAIVPLSVSAHQSAAGNLLWAALVVPFAAVGVVVAHRQPWNAIGWILVALGLAVSLGFDASLYAVLAYRVDHHALLLARLAVALAPFWVPLLVLLPLPVLLFPEGRVPRGGWRWTFWGYLALVTALLISVGRSDVAVFTDRRVVVDSSGQLVSLRGSSSGLGAFANHLLVVAYAAIFLSWLLRQLLCYRRSTGDERQQLKWLLSGGAVGVFGLLFGAVTSGAHSPVIQLIGGLAFLSVVALPVGLGMGILKYRLYEIDRLISRTISYAILTATLVAVFVGIVALTTRVLPFSSPVAVAASTLAAAALFNPLRLRLQHVVDRRFNRARYDAEKIVAAFSARLQDAVDLDAVSGDLLAAVRSVQPAHASIWIRPRSSDPRA